MVFFILYILKKCRLKLLVDSLEAEVFSDVDAYKYENYNNEMITDYDEVFEDDDG